MDSDDELDNFRHRWKQELESDPKVQAPDHGIQAQAEQGPKKSTSTGKSQEANSPKLTSDVPLQAKPLDIPSHSQCPKQASHTTPQKQRLPCENSIQDKVKSPLPRSGDAQTASGSKTVDSAAKISIGTLNFWWDKPDNAPEPFQIADKLLQGKSAAESFSSSNSDCVNLLESDDHFHFVKNKRLKLNSSQSSQRDSNTKTKSIDEPFIDLFLKDLEEINDIPFFEMEISREVAINIFKHLDIIDLCKCAQVSRAWRSLAGDELLWCRISHRLGYDQDTLTAERQKWKDIVRENVEKERQLQHNWKTRTGCLMNYQHVPGGVMCAADWRHDVLAAGFSNGDVRLWDLTQDEDWTLTPSNTALQIMEDVEFGTTENQVTGLAVTASHVAATYSQGNTDVWDLTEGTTPVHTFHCNQRISHITSSAENSIWAVAYGNHVRVEGRTDECEGFTQIDSITVEDVAQVSGVCLTPTSGGRDHVMIVAANDKALLQRVGAKAGHVTTLHHAIGQSVTSMDASATQAAVAVDAQDSFRVKLCCLATGRQVSVLEGNTYRITALDLRHSPPFSLVTGAADRKLRIFDTRVPFPVLTLRGHGAPITCVQMDDWKVVSGSKEGLVCVWDQRIRAKLWEMHNRHPVGYLRFHEERLLMAHIPVNTIPEPDDTDRMLHRRHRGELLMYNFSDAQIAAGLPSNAYSTYDDFEGYSYNIKLQMPYDNIS